MRIASERTRRTEKRKWPLIHFPAFSRIPLGLILVNSAFLSVSPRGRHPSQDDSQQPLSCPSPEFSREKNIARTGRFRQPPRDLAPRFRSSFSSLCGPLLCSLSSSLVRIILQKNSLPSSSSSEDDRQQDASTEDDQPRVSKVGRKRGNCERCGSIDSISIRENRTRDSLPPFVREICKCLDLTKRIDKRTTEDSASFAFIVSSSPNRGFARKRKTARPAGREDRSRSRCDPQFQSRIAK